jgi:hypothetical protein
MKRTNIILSLCLSAICALYAIAQQPATEPDKAKLETEKKALELVEQILSESQSLKLPENRLRIKAMSAGMLWEKDQPRARTYFQETENDLKQMIQALGNEQNNRERKADEFTRFRSELLRNLSQLDPQLALDLLRSTKLPDEYRRQYNGGFDPEVQLEAELASRIASRDPAKALKMAEELLEKGFSFQILNTADSLRGTEQGRAAVTEIYKKVISKFATTDFLGNQEAVSMAERMLYLASNEAQMRARMSQAQAASTTSEPARPMPTITDDQMFRELIEATAKAAAKNSTDNMRASNANRLKSTLQSMQSSVEKLAPAQAAALKTRPAAPGAPNAPTQQGFNPNVFNELNSMMSNPATTNDQLIEFAKKAGTQEQSQLFQQIASRVLMKGETEQAKQIIDTYVKDPRAKENFERMRDSIAMNNAMRKGNLEEAKQIIARIESPQRRADQMISLSYQIAQKDKAAAAALLDEAALLLGTQVETVQQVQTLINLSRAFGAVTPERSFDLADGMVSKFNTVIAAASIIDVFEGRNAFEQGEAKVGAGGGMFWLNNFTNNLMYLASLDFERAKTTAERFDRPETRLNALVYVASGILRPRPQPQIGAGVMPMPPTVIRR